MLLHRSPPLLFIALLCASVLFVRGGGMHLHLCFDGNESPTEVHWADGGVHNDAEHASQPHDDQDVGFGDVVAKTSKGLGDQPVAIFAVSLLLLVLPLSSERPSLRPAAVHSTPRFFQPPMRGPPL